MDALQQAYEVRALCSKLHMFSNVGQITQRTLGCKLTRLHACRRTC